MVWSAKSRYVPEKQDSVASLEGEGAEQSQKLQATNAPTPAWRRQRKRMAYNINTMFNMPAYSTSSKYGSSHHGPRAMAYHCGVRGTGTMK